MPRVLFLCAHIDRILHTECTHMVHIWYTYGTQMAPWKTGKWDNRGTEEVADVAYGYPYQPYYGGNQMTNPGAQQMQPGAQGYGQQGMQPGALFARYVACREEAVAAQVIPDGNMNVFVDSAHGRIYTKAVAPGGMADFRDYGMIQPRQAEGQTVTMEMYMALRSRLEQIEQALTAQQARGGKAGEGE